MKITPENIKWFKRRDGLEFYPVLWSPIGVAYHYADDNEDVLECTVKLDGQFLGSQECDEDLIPIFESGEAIRVWSDTVPVEKACWCSFNGIDEDGKIIQKGYGPRWQYAMPEADWQEKYGKPEPKFPKGWPVRVPYIPHICDGYGSLDANWSLEKYSGQPRAVCAIEWQNEHAPLQMDEAVKVWADPDGPVSAMPRHYADKGQCWINGNTSHSGAASREWNNIMRASDWQELYG